MVSYKVVIALLASQAHASFLLSCVDCIPDFGALFTCHCPDGTGKLWNTIIDLNSCLTNKNGGLAYQKK